jgi:hypothetical protein
MNVNNHIASARPLLFSAQRLIRFSLYRARRIVKFRSLGRLPKESTQVRGPLKHFVTMHQALNNNLLIFCASMRSVCHPVDRSVMCYWASSAQSFLVFRPVGSRDDIFILSILFMYFEKWGYPSSRSRVRFLGEIRIPFLASLFPSRE